MAIPSEKGASQKTLLNYISPVTKLRLQTPDQHQVPYPLRSFTDEIASQPQAKPHCDWESTNPKCQIPANPPSTPPSLSCTHPFPSSTPHQTINLELRHHGWCWVQPQPERVVTRFLFVYDRPPPMIWPHPPPG